MENKIKISIVIPAYNEQGRIEGSLRKIKAFFDERAYDYEIIVSDDGSKDKTLEIVKKFQESWPELKALNNLHKGKAPAIISGINSAQGEFVLFTDVDLSVDIGELPKLLYAVEDRGYDVAIASREGKGAKRIDEPTIRHVMGRVFNYLVQLVILPGINDTQCGFKLFRTSSAIEIFKHTLLYSLDDEVISGGKVSAFDVEILYLAKRMGLKIKEVPVVWIYQDESKVHNIKDSYYNAKDVLVVRLNSLLGKYKV